MKLISFIATILLLSYCAAGIWIKDIINPIAKDVSYRKYCLNNFDKYLRVEVRPQVDCNHICSVMKNYYKSDCNYNLRYVDDCYGYMYCWKHNIFMNCGAYNTLNEMGVNCLKGVENKLAKDYDYTVYKVAIGNSVFETNNYKAHKRNNGKLKSCRC
ncbi:hypothetical protein PIROE2DRAFT_16154 [Piromyces sp. E2]|nr:hypothetical protein PIROE2DRAFT_16154 [Piromyces sp. E2]|eukprot:OUM58537.1 hypothetical protein PIROE2DRAFT_16154 [Piromyces sp. E2]